MKRADIKDGVVYWNDNKTFARRVICITDDPKDLPPASYQRKLKGPWVLFEVVRGKGAGMGDALTVRSFALWAGSVDGEGDLRDCFTDLKADRQALLNVVRKAAAVADKRKGDLDALWRLADLREAVDALPDHIKEEIEKGDDRG